MPIFSVLIIGISIVFLFTLVGRLLHVFKFDYLFVNYCIAGASLCPAINYLKIRFDHVIVFNLELYKYFLLVIATTVYGIIMSNRDIDE